MARIKAAVLFGGQSSEHEVSCVSAVTVIKNMDADKYDVVIVGITKDGRWLRTESVADIESGRWRESRVTVILSPDRSHGGLVEMTDKGCKNIPVDVVFPVLHGLYGEDGTVQGILELAGIPYVGCGVLASAVSMDKLYTKIIVDSIGGIRQAKYIALRRHELKDMKRCAERVESVHKYPVFIKPVNAGSSRGVSKADNRAELEAGLLLAASHDEKILVEETIIGREVECAVFGGLEPEASGVGEVLAAGGAAFYDYDAKYNNAESRTDTAPTLPEGCEEEIRKSALAIFKAVDGFGLARVDFFIENGTDRVVFNELNTMPGFTSISMYPMLWEALGTDRRTLVDKLIRTAFDRHKQV
ncbi:MAG: D-alanine--D-alanine ligase [Butyrivibrio sp.]|nr:D-alanine--D-alanine ligase [Butyrivibrio sp.]